MRLAILALFGFVSVSAAQVTKSDFGKMPDGKVVTLYTLKNKHGMVAKVTTYGAILTELHVPDKDGKLADVVMGFDNLDDYLKGHPYFGSNVGRCANRIAKGEFTLEGKKYTLAKNNNDKHHLHGGKEGFDKKLWTGKIIDDALDPTVKFSYTSPDGEEGYPGELKASVSYTLTDDNELKLHFEATANATTVCSLAHHSYFNLAGHGSGDILKHKLEIKAQNYTPTNDELIPTGKLELVAGTLFDFRKPTEIGARIKENKGTPVGYDVNFDVGEHDDGPAVVAVVTEPKSGRKMEILSTEPGLQFYSGNFLDGKLIGKDKAVYNQYGAFCLEPQYFPNAVNVGGWYSPVIKPGQQYYQDTIFKFSIEK